MPAPLIPLLANTIGRLVTANVTRGVAGVLSRSAVTSGGSGAASAAAGNARSPLQYVLQYAKNKSRIRATRARRAFTRNAPGFAQAHRWKNINKAFGQLQRARSAKQSAMQVGDPLKVQQAEEQEERAKQRLAKETKALLESFSGLKRGLIGVVIALHTLPFAIQSIGRARVDTIRSRSGLYSGQTAGALAKYDVGDLQNKLSSSRVTSQSDVRMIEATQRLNNSLKPISDSLHVLGNEVLIKLIDGAIVIAEVVKEFNPLIQPMLWWFGKEGFADMVKENIVVGPMGINDPAVQMLRGGIGAAMNNAKLGKDAMQRQLRPLKPGKGP